MLNAATESIQETGSKTPVDWSRSPSADSRSELNWSKLVTAVAVILIAIHLVLRFFFHVVQIWQQIPLWVALFLGAAPLLFVLFRNLLRGRFGSDFLAGVSILTAIFLREYLVATIVVLMLSGGTALETFATRKASQVLEMLAKRMPAIAHRKTAEAIEDVPAGEIAVGEVLVVLPHEICPVDGVVVEGRGSMNEAYLTGEPFEVEKAPGANVLSGGLNGESLLTIRAGKRSIDS